MWVGLVGTFNFGDIESDSDLYCTDIHFYLENPPQGQSDRWSGRSFRSFSVIHPPSPVNLDPTRTEADKVRFLENLWNVQATYRTKAGQSIVLSGEEMEVESRGGRVTLARTYFNIYQRTAFLRESKKASLNRIPLILASQITNGSFRLKLLYTSTLWAQRIQFRLGCMVRRSFVFGSSL